MLKELWGFGVSDAVFNFSINCGYNAKSKLILIDFNEINLNHEDTLKNIQNKAWRERSSFLRLTQEKQKIFKRVFEAQINSESLVEYWGKNKV